LFSDFNVIYFLTKRTCQEWTVYHPVQGRTDKSKHVRYVFLQDLYDATHFVQEIFYCLKSSKSLSNISVSTILSSTSHQKYHGLKVYYTLSLYSAISKIMVVLTHSCCWLFLVCHFQTNALRVCPQGTCHTGNEMYFFLNSHSWIFL
jgi:hypothetical protein